MTEPSTPSQLLKSSWKIIPHFQCSDIQKAIKFYGETLGFKCEPDEEKPFFLSIWAGKRADANIYLFRTEPSEIQPSVAMIALGTKELDAYYDYLSQRDDVEITMEKTDQPWGFRQFEIRDPDGNKLQFFKFLEGGNPGSD